MYNCVRDEAASKEDNLQIVINVKFHAKAGDTTDSESNSRFLTLTMMDLHFGKEYKL
jgi:hypothetical protein